MTLPAFPIRFVDLIGAVLMIVFSLLSLLFVFRLRHRDRENIVWTYLLWVCMSLVIFSISRSAGHILKQVLIFSGRTQLWNPIRPISGAINTVMFMVVASVTIFFGRIWSIYQEILKDRQALQTAHEELSYLNQNLEKLVARRTEALAVSEHKYRRIFEVSKDMILVAADDGRIVDLNPVGYEMLGCPEEDGSLENRHLQDFLADESVWPKIRTAIAADGFIANAEIEMKRMDGSRMMSLVSGSMDEGPSEGAYTIHFLVKDIEQRKSMEQQMAQADKLASIGQLAAGIAHEINNPLGIILGYAQLLQRNETAHSERYQDLKTIEKHVRNCKLIVEDLLNFARSSDPQNVSIDIHTAMNDALNFIRHHSDLGSIKVVRQYADGLPALKLDDKKIKQILINLIMNAKDAVGTSGTIRLTTAWEAASRQVRIQVADSGYGIEPRHLSRIFDPFFTTKPPGDATGLGLSVSYAIIKNHGGSIAVKSHPGQGTCFTILLPAHSRAAVSKETDRNAAKASGPLTPGTGSYLPGIEC